MGFNPHCADQFSCTIHLSLKRVSKNCGKWKPDIVACNVILLMGGWNLKMVGWCNQSLSTGQYRTKRHTNQTNKMKWNKIVDYFLRESSGQSLIRKILHFLIHSSFSSQRWKIGSQRPTENNISWIVYHLRTILLAWCKKNTILLNYQWEKTSAVED